MQLAHISMSLKTQIEDRTFPIKMKLLSLAPKPVHFLYTIQYFVLIGTLYIELTTRFI